MEWIKLKLTNYGNYLYVDASNVEMNILGNFLSSDVGCDNREFFKEWALSDENAWAVSGNITVLEKEGDYIYLTEQYSEEKDPTELKISRNQFVKLFDEWREKVCKSKPKEVMITEKDGEFSIETKD
jgi:hypothetical protein